MSSISYSIAPKTSLPTWSAKTPSFYDFYHSSSALSSTPRTMNHPGPVSSPNPPWSQSQTFPSSYDPTMPPIPSTQVNYPGMVNLTIPLEYLNQPTTLERLPRENLKEIIFLGPHSNSIDFFLNSRDVLITRAIHYLNHVHYLEKTTFPFDFPFLTIILETLAAIPGMQEIELTLPAFNLERHSFDMVNYQNAFIRGLKSFSHLTRLTIPMEFVTTLLLSHLAILPNLNSLTVKYSPPPPSPHHQQQQQQFPEWSSYTIPSECPGYIFLAHLQFDPRGFFRNLTRLELLAPSGLSDASYTILRRVFPPETYIC